MILFAEPLFYRCNSWLSRTGASNSDRQPVRNPVEGEHRFRDEGEQFQASVRLRRNPPTITVFDVSEFQCLLDTARFASVRVQNWNTLQATVLLPSNS